MPSTSAKGLEVQVTGSNAGTWGTVLNDNMISYVDTFLGGITSLSLSSTGVALTQAQCRNVMLRMTGALLAGIVIQPDVGVLLTGFVYWENLTTNSQTVTFTNTGGSVVLPQSRRGILWADTTNGPRIIAIVGSASADPIPTGSKTIWYNTSAPSGWSAVALNDYAVKIVTTGSGGVTSGSVAYSTLYARTATDSHTLTIPEIPAHTHTYSQIIAGVTNPNLSVGGGAFTTGTSSSTGGGGGHTHDIDMRVLTAAFTLCSKD